MKLIEDEDIIRRFISFIETGNYIIVACKLSGLPYTTYTNWRELSRKADKRGDYDNKYYKVMARIERAKYVAENKMLQVVKDCAFDGDSKSAQWYLARKAPERWGKKDNVNISQDKNFKIEFVTESEEDAKSEVETNTETDKVHE